MRGGAVGLNSTIDESVDDTTISVTGKLIIKNKDTGKVLYEEELLPTVDPDVKINVHNTAEILEKYLTEVGERAAQKALEYIDAGNMPESVVEGDTGSHDNRTYTMVEEDGERKMKIEGNYGHEAVYTLVLEVLTDKNEVNITPDPTDGPRPTHPPLGAIADDEVKDNSGIIIVVIIISSIFLLLGVALVIYIIFKNKKNKQ